MATPDDYEAVGASLDLIGQGLEPGTRRVTQDLPEAGDTLQSIVGAVHHGNRGPSVWVDLTADRSGHAPVARRRLLDTHASPTGIDAKRGAATRRAAWMPEHSAGHEADGATSSKIKYSGS
jgi:hypothetical protein